MINSRTDCHALSKEVVNHCDLIHHSRLAEVEQIIYYIKKRKLQSSGKSEWKFLSYYYVWLLQTCSQNMIQNNLFLYLRYKTFIHDITLAMSQRHWDVMFEKAIKD